jgi:protein O-mannosyl-transferase
MARTVPDLPSEEAPADVQAGAARPGRTGIFHLLMLSGIAFGLYAPALRNGFVSDDESEVLHNPLIRSFANLGEFFAHSVWYFAGAQGDRYYRPLKLLAYTVGYHLFGFRPAYWHLANILVNLAVVIAIYFLVRDLASPALGFWTAVIFAFHPVHVEAVAWIAAGNDLLCALMLLLSLWLYHRALYRTVQGRAHSAGGVDPSGHLRQARAGLKPGLTVLSAALFLAGLLFKETALIFPAIILAFDFFYRGDSLRKMLWAWRRYIAYLAALAVYLALRVHAIGRFAPNNPRLNVSAKEFLLTAPALAADYVWKALAPVNLKAWYGFHPITGLGWKPAGAIALCLFLVWAVFRLRPAPGGMGLRRGQPLLSFALAWFLLFLVPVLDIPKLGDSVFAERYLYIPTVGFCIFGAWAWVWLHGRASRLAGASWARAAVYAGLLGLLVFYSAVIIRRLPVWHDDLRLWTRTAQQEPDDAAVLSAAGNAYYRLGRPQDALGLFERAVAAAPREAYAHNGLGGALVALGRDDDALRQFQEAVALDPAQGSYWRNLGVAYARKKQWPQAIEAFRRAVREFQSAPSLAPGTSGLFLQLGAALEEGGQLDDAISSFRRAIELDPANLDAHIRLAGVLAGEGRLDAARDALLAGLRANPRSAEAYLAHFDLGRIYARQGLRAESQREYEQALALNPSRGATPLGLVPLTPRQAKPSAATPARPAGH